jgi:hypothetical protein
MGTEDLTEVWETGYSGASDLENPPRHTSFDRFVKDYKAIGRRIEMREKQLAQIAARAKPPPATPSPKTVASKTVTSEAPAPQISPLPIGLHGLPLKPVNPLGMPTRASTPTITAVPPAAAPPKEKALEPIKEVPEIPSKPAKITDPQLDAFVDVSIRLEV